MTLYHMRLIERLWGSRKFAVRLSPLLHSPNPVSSNKNQSFLLTIHPLISLLPPLLLSALLRPLSLGALNYLPAGPTPLVFALLAQYHAAIPHVYKYRIATSSPTPTARQANSSSASASATTSSTSSSSPASASDPTGLLFSDKTMTYILASQLALSQLPGSLLAATVGWGVGVAWRNYLLPERVVEWRVPAWVVGEAARDGLQGERAREGFEGLRRRLEGEGRASGVESREQVRRRGLVGGMVDQFRGMF